MPHSCSEQDNAINLYKDMIPLNINIEVLLPILALCAVKFLVGTTAMSTFISQFGIIGTILLSSLFGIIGATISVFFGEGIQTLYNKIFPNKPKRFSWFNRKLAWMRNKTGLIGIAFLTPIILSIPIGTLIALSLAKDKSKVVFYIGISCLFWATIILTPIYVLEFNWVEYIKSLF